MNLKDIFILVSENYSNVSKYKFMSISLIFIIGIGSLFVRYVDNNIGPRYFVLLNKNENF